jgi:hypothetical protein
MFAVGEQIREPFRARRKRKAVRVALGLALLLGMPVAGQAPYPQFPSTNNGNFGQRHPESNSQFGPEPSQDPRRLRLLNAQRQKELVSDTEKLLQLAKELNEEVSDANSAEMTDAQLRKVAEIAKLARSVKEKMSFTVGGYPTLKGPQIFDNQ